MKGTGKLSDIQKKFNHGQKVKLEVGVQKHLQDDLLKQSFVEEITKHHFDHKKLSLELVLKGDEDMRPELVSWLVSQKVPVYSLELSEFDLEEIFMKLTEGESV